MPLGDNDARRAVLVAGLLASDKDGEVVNAARSLCGLLRKGDLDPRAVIEAGLRAKLPTARPPRPQGFRQPPGRPLRERARMASYSPHLNDFERDFLQDIANWQTLTPKQEALLRSIIRKSEGGGR